MQAFRLLILMTAVLLCCAVFTACSDSCKGSHIAGEWEILTEPTANAAGMQQKKCTVCGDILLAEEIPAKDTALATPGLEYRLLEGDAAYGVKVGPEARGLTEIYIPATYNGKPVTKILQEAFGSNQPTADKSSACIYLRTVHLPNSITAIEDYAFMNCVLLESIALPDGLKSIGKYAFKGCQQLTAIAIPDSVESIGTACFASCGKLESATLSAKLTEIAPSLFQKCTKLRAIDIPKGVTKIDTFAFGECMSLSSVTLSETVTEIGNGAFSGCEELASISIPNNLQKLGSPCFSFCDKLPLLTYEGVRYLGSTENPYLIAVDSVKDSGEILTVHLERTQQSTADNN